MTTDPGKARRAAGSAVREPLSHALGTRGKVACLRLLSLITEPLTQRELARRTHVQHRTVQIALDELVALGLVSRIEGGRDYLVTLNREHRLASPLAELFRREAEHFLELRRSLVAAVEGGKPRPEVLSLVLFGSVARGADLAASDVDILLIARSDQTREAAVDRIEAHREALRRRFGVSVRLIGYTRADARRIWRAGGAPFPDIRRDGIVLLGPPLGDVLNGTS